ncbi:DUF2844 domain-containing protein [Burkholderia sp. PAMC 26561]|jgi:Protein of unknown function (DUF2844)|uniref:DUF2844 domain-containing protein n=1 Tax=Burkholderia sp. PAMC 26561 TaxID=1795043 RepID=UPI00084D6146|nr:DUF2844 domain-containing protein [Burkholderia sp. PAMC 26561]
MSYLHTLTSLRAASAVLLAAAAGSVHAQLGSTLGNAAIGSGTSNALAAVIHQAGNSAVRWQETTDANQIRVRQYLSPATGLVYAVSWDGPAMPDVSALLGTWFDRYRQGASAALESASGLHSSRVDGSDFVVETHVRLRDFSGRAWLPDALPAGVAAADIE